MIARMWRGWVRTEDRDVYAAYVEETGVAQYRETAVALSFWESREVITGFAGADISRAVFYPEDDRYLVAREDTGTHYEVHVG